MDLYVEREGEPRRPRFIVEVKDGKSVVVKTVGIWAGPLQRPPL